jgi:proline dehydrogenase
MQAKAMFPDFSFDDTAVAFSYKNNAQLRHAQALFNLINQSWLVRLATTATPLAFKLGLPIKGLVKATIYKHFCGGETLDQCIPVIDTLAKHAVGTILDYGVEAKETEEEFEKSTNAFVRSLEFASKHLSVPFISIKVTGLCAFHLLESLHKGEKLSPTDKEAWSRTEERVDRICAAAAKAGASVMVDAEETWIQKPIDDLTNAMMLKYNRERCVVMNTVQLYRKDRYEFLVNSFEELSRKNVIVGMKLVRGAYMEKERLRAKRLGYDSPIQPSKQAADSDYDRAASFCLNNVERISFCIASHNEFSNFKTATDAAAKNIPTNHPHLHFSQLYGMSDNITFNLAREGYNVTKYLPYGPVRDVIPYLMRRAQENTSVGGQTSRELQLINKELKRRKAVSA